MPVPVERIDLWVVDLDRWMGTADRPTSRSGRRGEGGVRPPDPVATRRLTARRSLTRSLVAGALGLDPADLVIDRHCPRCGAADHGRPTVRGGGIEFSVSSSGRLAAVAVADRPVGVDVELARTGVAPLDAALSPREQDALVGLDGHRRDGALLRLWTAKEAVLKAAGRDLGDDPSRIDVAGLLTTSSVEVGCGGRQWVVRHPALDPSVADQAVVAVADGWGAAVVRRSVDDRPSQDAT